MVAATVTYTRHQISEEYADLNGKEWTAFLAGFREHGFKSNHPIVLYCGMILDGWQRYLACRELEIDPIFIEYADITECGDPRKFVESENDQRRHETADMRDARIAKRREEVVVEHAAGESTRAIAKKHDVSHTTVRRDLENASSGTGVPPDAETDENSKNPEKTGGATSRKKKNKENKENRLCERCARVGAVAACEACAEERKLKPRGRPKMKNPGRNGKPPAPPKSSDEMKDDFGNDVPKRCRAAFGDPWIQHTFDTLAIFAEDFRKHRYADGMNKRKRAFPAINAKDFIDGIGMIDATLDKIIQHIKENRPAGVCPPCDGKGCSDCSMSGLVSRKIYGDLKKKAK